MARALRRVLAVVAVIGLAAWVGVGWYYSNEILRPVSSTAVQREVTVAAIGAGTVTLTKTEASAQDGTYGLDAQDGYAQVGPIIAADATTVRRPLTSFGRRLSQGDRVAMDGYAFPPPPLFGLGIQDATVPSALGDFPALFDAGTNPSATTWAIHVHGRGAAPREGFRAVSTLHSRLPSLLITYRNDDGAPPSPNGLYGLGFSEWVDLEAAVDYAAREGARDVVLFGYSNGGAIVLKFLQESTRAGMVRGVVLDAPALNWGPILRFQAQQRGVPVWVTPWAMTVATLRGGIDFAELNQIARADEFTTPILLFHGTADRSIPIELSQEFAAARPDLVTFVPVEGAGHVRSWNADPDQYGEAIEKFLADIGLLG